jgi:uncharacterized alkaline shock family protein YloU
MTELARTELGRIEVSASTLQRIVARAAEQVEGIRVPRTRRNPRIEVAGGAARIEVVLEVGRGTIVPAAARAVQQCVTREVGSMLEMRIGAVDVSVERIF